MEYNTIKKKLTLPEYGRNVQMMAEHLLTIEDRNRRTEAAKELVAIMVNMNPTVRETKDYKKKIWNFLFQLCEYKLDVDTPFQITETKQMAVSHKRLQYNQNNIRCRHYGYTVERLIDAAVAYEEGEEKEALIKMIANNMKRNYVVWNQKSVTDEIIINDLNKLSKGCLNLNSDIKLMNVSVQPQQSQQKKNNNFKRQNNGQGKNNNKNKNNNNNKRQ